MLWVGSGYNGRTTRTQTLLPPPPTTAARLSVASPVGTRVSEVARDVRSVPFIVLMLALGLAGCRESKTVGGPDAASGADGGASTLDAAELDAGYPDAGASDAGEGDSGGPACPQRITWGQGPEFPEPRDHHATFVWTGASGPSLYVVGGFNGGVFTNAWRAAILADGSLGAWQDAGPPNARTAGMALARHGDRIYLLGGHSGAGRIPLTSSFTIGQDGLLTETRAEADLPEPRFHASAAVFGDFVFVTGGLGTRGEAEATVLRAGFDEAGALTEWTPLDPLPDPRSHHSSFVQDGYVYLVGGFSGNPVGERTTYHPNAIRAEVHADGTLGAWQDLGLTLPAGGLSTHANAAFEGCVLTFGGITDTPTAVSDGVLKLDLVGASAEALSDSALPVPRSHVHHAPVHAGFVYLVSGKDTFSSDTATVLIGRLQ